MTTKTDICNMALGYIGVTKNITDMDTDTTNEAKRCRSAFENYYEIVLTSYPWTFASAVTTLTETDSESQGFEYCYLKPNDCLKARAVADEDANFMMQNYFHCFDNNWPLRLRNQFVMSLNDDKDHQTILTNIEGANLLYTAKVDFGICSAPFYEALALRLASFLAMALPHSINLSTSLTKQYQQAALNATVLDANQSARPFSNQFDNVRARIC